MAKAALFMRFVIDNGQGGAGYVDSEAHRVALNDKKRGISVYRNENGTGLLKVVTIDRLKLALKKCTVDNGRGGTVFVAAGTNLRGVRSVVQAYKDEAGARPDRAYASHRLSWV